MSYRIILAKILPASRVKDFLDGNLYLNPASFFAKLDASDLVRSDPHEGISESWQVKEVAVADEHGSWLPLPEILGPVTVRSRSPESLNVLCLYSLTDRDGDSFDPRNLDFGTNAIAIVNLSKFLGRLKNAAQAASKTLTHGPIEYVDSTTYHGPMGPFRKFSRHNYQNEFRFVLDGGDGKACQLQIGNIRDIAITMPSSEIPQFWNHMRTCDA